MATEKTTNVDLDKPIFPSENLAPEFDTLIDQIDTEFGKIGSNWTVSDSGTEVIQDTVDLNFQSDIEVVDDGDGSITVNSTAVSPDELGVADGVAELDSNAEVLSSQLPSLVLTETDVVLDEAERLSLDAEKGDIAIQQDENKSYILKGTDPTVNSDWTVLKSPTDAVDSVFGRTGSVTAQSGDYDHSQIGNITADDHHSKYTNSEAQDAVSGTNLSVSTLDTSGGIEVEGSNSHDYAGIRAGSGANNGHLMLDSNGGNLYLNWEDNGDVRIHQGRLEDSLNANSNNINNVSSVDAVSYTTNNFEITENSSTNSLDFNYTG